jgi:hypothetical protein
MDLLGTYTNIDRSVAGQDYPHSASNVVHAFLFAVLLQPLHIWYYEALHWYLQFDGI